MVPASLTAALPPPVVTVGGARVYSVRTRTSEDWMPFLDPYATGTSAARLAREYRVDPHWLAGQLAAWGVPVRDQNAAVAVRRSAAQPR
ncbi:hypothetical protein AB0D49_13065 [Streptomyces sp. NPDC048290]|uniref:hypothetical protein n=1 Tax=Streptomyces sp. NPDC048290 TaxID=3155811 RepID=UPI00341DC1E6